MTLRLCLSGRLITLSIVIKALVETLEFEPVFGLFVLASVFNFGCPRLLEIGKPVISRWCLIIFIFIFRGSIVVIRCIINIFKIV